MSSIDRKINLPPSLLSLANTRLEQQSQASPDIIEALTVSQYQLLGQALALSDFIEQQLTKNPHWLTIIFEHDILTQPRLSALIDKGLSDALATVTTEKELEQVLRQQRNFFQLIIAWRDLCHLVALPDSLLDVSYLAQALIIGARDWLANFLIATWGYPVDELGQQQPLLIIGMGKLGGRELNFSSDIDLIFTYPEQGETINGRRAIDNQQYFVKLAQKLISALDKQTFDGFVYRVDMRLRPFGDSGPLVASFAAMEDYYQLQGRDWERYAMVKGRILGPACEYTKQLTNLLRPFMFRRYIDFSAIESLRQMKQMINQEVRRRGLIDNIKLGGGGIREVEFIVQAFQMIRGGREPQLQQQSLLKTLVELQRLTIFSESEVGGLRESYLHLRACEQYLQQFNDQQTQTLPANDIDWARLCYLTDNSTESQFRVQLQQHLDVVSAQFSQVVGSDDSSESGPQKDLSLLRVLWDCEQSFDGESILFELGCAKPQALFDSLGVIKDDIAKRSMGPRGIEAMNKLMPLLLMAVKELNDAALVLTQIGKILSKIASRTAYIELLLENPGALTQLVRLCQASCWIAEKITQFPMLLDELLDPKLLYQVTPIDDYANELRRYLMRVPEDDLEQMMEALRQFKQVQQLHIAAADVTGVLSITKVSDHLTALAQAVIGYVVNLAWQQICVRHGQPSHRGQDKGFAVIGYGKLGGIELGYGSDLDLVFVHCATDQSITNGDKPIDSYHFYLKLAQRIIHLFNTRTNSGILYEVDMRLRPSGHSGLLVSHIDTFIDYQQQEAWIWEHQALVRTRIIDGDSVLKGEFEAARHQILQSQRDVKGLQQEVIKMRLKMRDNLSKGSATLFDIKQDIGGIADIEFIAQYLVLANSRVFPGLTDFSDKLRIFSVLSKHNLISGEESTALQQIYCQYRDTGHRLSLQNASNIVSSTLFVKERKYIEEIWQKVFSANINR